MARIVTFENKGVAKISDYAGNYRTDKEIVDLLHKSSYRENLVARLRELTNNKNLEEMSVISLGYALEELINSRVHSTINKIEFHNGKTLNNFGVK